MLAKRVRILTVDTLMETTGAIQRCKFELLGVYVCKSGNLTLLFYRDCANCKMRPVLKRLMITF
jgi:hypothetical protein